MLKKGNLQMRTDVSKSRGELPCVRTLLDMAFDTLGDLGVESYSELNIYICGYRDGKRLHEISVQNGVLRLSTPRTITPLGRESNSATASRHSVLIIALCRIIRLWQWNDEEIASYLRSGTCLLARWIEVAISNADPDLPQNVMNQIHKLIAIDHLRLAAGIEDADVSTWVRKDRLTLHGRSLLDVLKSDGDIGFRNVQSYIMGTVLSENATVH